MLLNDSLAFKLAMFTNASSMTGEARNKLTREIQFAITPDFENPQDEIDKKMPALMKELENTIVTFDRESMRSIQRDIKNEKMRI